MEGRMRGKRSRGGRVMMMMDEAEGDATQREIKRKPENGEEEK